MFGSPFFRRLFVPYLVLICATTAAVGLVGADRVRATYQEGRLESLRAGCALVQELLAPFIAPVPSPDLSVRTRELAWSARCRITIIDRQGKVLADSEGDPAQMEPHNDRPEIVQAAKEGEGNNVHLSRTLKQDLMYFARRFDIAGQPYYVRLAVHLDDLNRSLRIFYVSLGAAALVAMLAAALICYYFARRHAAPMVELTGFAEALSRGQLQRRTVVQPPGELGTLATSLNTMAESLSTLMARTHKSQAELLTILSSMSEGVIATDLQQRIVLVNEAAGALLSFQSASAANKLLCEALLNDRILKSAGEVLSTGKRQVIQIGPLGGKYLEVTFCTYPSHAPAEGLVILAHDVTQSVRYQELRKEFVANVSHELRTPLTVVKGFVETLLDGAMKDPEKAARYLATMERHTNQLSNLVSDLLEISRLESQPDLPRRESVDLGGVLRKTAELLLPAAQAKKHTLAVQAPVHLPAVLGNADYLERGIANLLDNAIKYTPEGGKIRLSAEARDGRVLIEVTDNGIGIPAEDIPRIFERFYRVDRSRSREMGGTGLGLSIVKHIAQVHGGTVDVTSTPGAGSTFRLTLPAATN